MRTYLAGNGMLAVIGEPAAYAGIAQRRLEEGLAQALPFLVPVLVAAVALVETDGAGGEAAAVVDCEFHVVNAYHFPLALRLVVDDAEAVSFLQAEEIHRPGIDVCQLYDKQRRYACGEHIVPQGAVNCDVRRLADLVHRFVEDPGMQGIPALEDGAADSVVMIDDVFELAARGVRSVVCLDGVAGTHAADVENAV